ncbi:MAG: hypothetical protein K2N00_02975 [Lachnospiraceae bacterium]|nr:hypothetical protein [Lachnospiraceae bacterium]
MEIMFLRVINDKERRVVRKAHHPLFLRSLISLSIVAVSSGVALSLITETMVSIS